MHKEYYECSEEIIQGIKRVKRTESTCNRNGGALPAVFLRRLPEMTTHRNSLVGPNLFIYPPYNFKYVDVLITNFHLPKTTLLLLVSAFAGRENIMNAYETAKGKAIDSSVTVIA